MKIKHYPLISCRLRPLALAVACALAGSAFAQNLPSGFNNVTGVNTPTTVCNTMTVTQTTQRGIAEWQSFSIGSGYSVRFNQPGSSSVLLNRVVGNDLSTIAGSLTANGHIYLINPNGVLFSQGSSVNVGGLIASTLNISNSDFLTGGALKFSRSDGNNAAVINEGSITAASGGTIGLMAARVTNSGTLSAPEGTVGLVSARTVNVDFDGDGLTTFTIPGDSLASAAWVENSGQVDADGGRIALLAASTVREQVVNQSGTLRARSLSSRGGEIVLGGDTASGNEVSVSGELDVSGSSAGVAGGSVSIDASSVMVEGARIDASGVGQGGNVAVNAGAGNVGLFNGSIDASGTTQGGNVGVYANTAPGQSSSGIIAMDKEFVIHADATGPRGDGGQIILLADAVTRAHGTLTARAGRQGGDGGFVEPSAAVLEVSGIRVDASAPAGKAGEWLLDPYDIYIRPGAGSPPHTSPWFESWYDDTVVYVDDINYHLNLGTDVTIMTGSGGTQQGNITFESGVVIRKTSGADAVLSLWAHNDIKTHANTVIESTVGALNVIFQAGGQVVHAGRISTNGGLVRLYGAGGVTTLNGSTISGGRIDIVGGSDFHHGPGLSIGSGSTISSTGDVILRASNDGASDALRINGRVNAGGVLNLRPGGVYQGNASDLTDVSIVFSPTNSAGEDLGVGFSISAAELARLSAPTIVVGGDMHVANIAVSSAITTSSALTLQNNGYWHGYGSSGITLNAPVSASTLGLVSTGNIMQGSASRITANNLFVSSGITTGYSSPGNNVNLQSNNNVNTVSGQAEGDFAFVNSGALTIGPVSVTGYGYDGAYSISAGSHGYGTPGTLTANTVLVQTQAGDLTLAMPISSSSTDLVAGWRFHNLVGANPISGGPWRVWAGLQIGETRGGMLGTGDDIFDCAWGACAVGSQGNYFIYAPLSDLFGGTLPIPVEITENDSDTVDEWLMAEEAANFSFAQICLNTLLSGSVASAGTDNDVLGREWSRVRAKPRAANCLGVDGRKGCSDF